MLSIKELIIGVSKFRLCKSELRDPVSTGWRHLPIGQKTSSAGQRGAAFATSRAQRQLGNWETWLPCVRETMIEYDKLVDWGAPPPKKKQTFQTHMEQIHYISLAKTQVLNNQTVDAFW